MKKRSDNVCYLPKVLKDILESRMKEFQTKTLCMCRHADMLHERHACLSKECSCKEFKPITSLEFVSWKHEFDKNAEYLNKLCARRGCVHEK